MVLSKLKADEPYTLYLYSAKGGAAGNATITKNNIFFIKNSSLLTPH